MKKYNLILQFIELLFNAMVTQCSKGIHGCIEPGIYENSDTHIIVDVDVASFYPNLAISNGFYPNHLGEKFCDVYKGIYLKRKEYAKGTAENYGLKIALNGAYGKSNDKYSFLYDPMFTMKITINGQLLLTMLAETLVDEINDLTMLQINTDGLTVKIPEEEYELLIKLCEDWEELTKLELEYAEYDKMIIRDVNNYSARYINGKVKRKGALEIDRDWHKNHSMKAVRLAVDNYFMKNVPVETTLETCDIFDFCKAFSVTKGWTPELHTLKGIKKLQKTNRYFISKRGGSFYKHHSDGRLNAVEAGETVEIMNDYDDTQNYLDRVDYQYYFKEANKIIQAIEYKQLKLF